MPSWQGERIDALPKGTVLRDYRIEAVLGYGGFGIVYRAQHNEVGHVVAIKEFLPAELLIREGLEITPSSSENEAHYLEGLRRFRDEARALVNLPRHPNVIACRDFFRANGTAYLVMDFVDGKPLSNVLLEREAEGMPFEESDLLAVVLPLAEGLAHVHRAGILHRDVKPANILIRRTDGNPVLVDFGAAKQVVAEHTKSLAPYTEGYAALEQVSDGELGPWTDVYAVGAVMWRMIAGGNRPWEPPNPTKVESRASALMHGVDDPLPSPQELGADRFSLRLLATVQRCLMVRESDRVRSSKQLLNLLKNGVNSSQEFNGQVQIEQHAPRSTQGMHDKSQQSRDQVRSALRMSLDSKKGLMALFALIIVIAGSCMPAFSDPIVFGRTSARAVLDEIGEHFGSIQRIESGTRTYTYYVSHLVIGSTPGKFIIALAILSLIGVLLNMNKLARVGTISGIIWTCYCLLSVPSINLSWFLMLGGFFLMAFSARAGRSIP